MNLNFKLRPYQGALIEGSRILYLRGCRSPLLVAPTGGGKTVVFSAIAASAVERGKRVLILVHRVELVRQTLSKLGWAGVKCGVISRKFKGDLTAPVQIASVQTLCKRLMKIPYEFDLIIIDEAHHAPAGSWAKIIKHYRNARVLGVTATPIRTDGSGLDGIFDSIYVGLSYKDLIEDGYLVKPLVMAPEHQINLTDAKMRMGDYEAEYLEKKFDKPLITGNAVEKYMKECPGKPAIVFCISVKHAAHVAAAFNENEKFKALGYRAAAVDGDLDDDTRQAHIDGLGDGSLQILTSCNIISEGTDIPVVFATIHLRPTQSLSLWLQQTGRMARPIYAPGFDLETREGRLSAIAASDKPYGLVLDHAGNCFTHGMPDDVREWTLVGFKESKVQRAARLKVPPVKQCHKCFAIHKPAPICPECGFEYPIEARIVEETEGELSTISPEMQKFINAQARHEVQKMRTLQQLQEYGIKKGYKPNWAINVYAARNKKQTGI